MRRKIIIASLVGMLLVALIPHVSAQGIGIVSETRDLGWVTTASSNVTVEVSRYVSSEEGGFSGTIYTYNHWNFTIECGASLPINLTIQYPEEFTPGENITVNISIESLEGYVFFNTSGYHKLNVSLDFDVGKSMEGWGEPLNLSLLMHLLLENSYSTQFMASLKTPIGENETELKGRMAHSGGMNLHLKYSMNMTSPTNLSKDNELDVAGGVDIGIEFDVLLIAKTKIIGNITASGTAVTETVKKTITWDSEGVKGIEIPISPNAGAKDTLSIGVDLEYIVEEFTITFSNITLNTNIDSEKISTIIGNEISEELYGIPLDMDIGGGLSTVIGDILSSYKGSFPLNITGIEKTRPIEVGIASESNGNTIESECPYDEGSLLSKSITIKAKEKPFYMRTETYLVIAAVVGVVVLAYVITKKNRSEK